MVDTLLDLALKAERCRFEAPAAFQITSDHPLATTLAAIYMLGAGQFEMLDLAGQPRAALAARKMSHHAIAVLLDLIFGLGECATAIRALSSGNIDRRTRAEIEAVADAESEAQIRAASIHLGRQS